MKTKLEKNVALNLETNSLKEKIESLQKSEKEKVKILDVKIAELKLISRKNENLQQELAESQKDLENLKSRQESESKVRYKCEQCEENVETVNQLKLHVGQNHSQSKSSQYDRDQCFEVYPCYYCDQAITCRKDLEDHEIKCIALLDELFQSPEVNIFPCDQCDVISMSMEELLKHINTCHPAVNLSEEHGCQLNPYYNEEDLKCCDFCGIKFGTLGGLRNHIRSLHRDKYLLVTDRTKVKSFHRQISMINNFRKFVWSVSVRKCLSHV